MKELLSRYPQLSNCSENITKAVEFIVNGYKNGGKVLVCGNGGSAADSEHIVGELMKGFISKRPLTQDEREALKNAGDESMADYLQRGIPAISLPSQIGVLSAFVNDVKPENIYAQLMFAYGTPSDTAICISTSGNSANIVNAAVAAKAKGTKVVALVGGKECKLDNIADVCIHVPETETYKIQELHLPVYHYICAEVEMRIFEKNEN